MEFDNDQCTIPTNRSDTVEHSSIRTDRYKLALRSQYTYNIIAEPMIYQNDFPSFAIVVPILHIATSSKNQPAEFEMILRQNLHKTPLHMIISHDSVAPIIWPYWRLPEQPT